MSAPSPIRVGILGTGRIARSFANAVRHTTAHTGAELVAVASRSAESATAFARDLDLPRAHTGYTALLDDTNVDAVYVALPNGLHATWTVQAARAGKHVLCEKPLADTADEVGEMFDAADMAGVVLLEAFPYAYHPQMHATLDLLRAGAIGTVRSVQAAFGFTLGDRADFRFDPALGGGALLDLGCYLVSFARHVVGARPERAAALARFTTDGVDSSLAGTLEYPGGAVAQLACSFETGAHRYAIVAGSDGVLETGFPNHTPARPGMPFRVRRGTTSDTPFEEIPVPPANGFEHELAAFVAMVRGPGGVEQRAARERSVDDALTLDALRESALRKTPVVVAPP